MAFQYGTPPTAAFYFGAGDLGPAVASVIAAGAIASASALGTPTVTAAYAPAAVTVVGAGDIASTLQLGVPAAAATYPSTGDEPVTITEAKIAARLEASDTAFDPLLAGLITAAREQAEQVTGRLYRDTTVRIELTDWPSPTYRLNVYAARAVAIQWWDGTAWQALAPEAFAFAAADVATVIAPALDTTWPALGRAAVGPRVRIDITAGPTTPSQVSEQVKLYIKALVSFWINRPDAGQSGPLQTNPHFDRLLDRDRLWH